MRTRTSARRPINAFSVYRTRAACEEREWRPLSLRVPQEAEAPAVCFRRLRPGRPTRTEVCREANELAGVACRSRHAADSSQPYFLTVLTAADRVFCFFSSVLTHRGRRSLDPRRRSRWQVCRTDERWRATHQSRTVSFRRVATSPDAAPAAGRPASSLLAATEEESDGDCIRPGGGGTTRRLSLSQHHCQERGAAAAAGINPLQPTQE